MRARSSFTAALTRSEIGLVAIQCTHCSTHSRKARKLVSSGSKDMRGESRRKFLESELRIARPKRRDLLIAETGADANAGVVAGDGVAGEKPKEVRGEK